MNNKNQKVLGILGGLGPMSSVYFYELVTSYTAAECDQEHIDIILSSRATTPDRTAYITGSSNHNPLPYMEAEARRLIAAGAEIIAMPCNTAHYFYDELHRRLPVAFLNIIKLTSEFVSRLGIRRVGLMATEGTVFAGGYDKVCREYGIECLHPDVEHQNILTSIIYGSLKRGEKPDMKSFCRVADMLTSLGAERIILGCTELSLMKDMIGESDKYIDSLDVLAACSVAACGKSLRGVPQALEEFALMTTADLEVLL